METGKGTRATFDVSGRDMATVYAEIRAAGYTNMTITDPTVLGTATFPAGSKVFYQSATMLTTAYAYYPGGGDPAGLSDVVTLYSPAVAAGGVATSQAAGVGCNSAEAGTLGTSTKTLEQMISLATGTPCVYAAGNFTYNNVLYYSGEKNEWWGNSTVPIGIIGTAPVGSGPAPGFYSGNVRLRIAFKGTGTNPVTYYACQERFNNGSTRNCTEIGSGTYSIQTLGDARVLTLSNAPAQAGPLTYNRIFVERGGVVYQGYKNKTGVTNTARFNLTGTNALMTQLGIPADDPAAPAALNELAYQGTWDVKDSAQATMAKGISVTYSNVGATSCQRRLTSVFVSCTLTITDASTGAFSLSMTDGTTATGTLTYLGGTGTGTYHDPTVTPSDGTFVAQRR